MFKKSINSFKKSNIFTSFCILLLTAICVSILSFGGGIAKANDAAGDVFSVPGDASIIRDVTFVNAQETNLKGSIIKIHLNEELVQGSFGDVDEYENFFVQFGLGRESVSLTSPDETVSFIYFKDGFTKNDVKYDVKYGFICTADSESLVPYGAEKLCDIGEINGKASYLYKVVLTEDKSVYINTTKADVYNYIYNVGSIFGCTVGYFYSDSLGATPVQPFEKTVINKTVIAEGENLKGKNAVMSIDIFQDSDVIDAWLAEDGRKVGDLYKLVSFVGNDVDIIAFKAFQNTDNLDYELYYDGIFKDAFDVFENGEELSGALLQGKIAIEFSEEKDYILENNEFYQLVSSEKAELSSKWLDEVKGVETAEDFFNIDASLYADNAELTKKFPGGIKNPKKVYAVTFNLSPVGISDVVIKIDTEDGYFYLPINANIMNDALYTESMKNGSKLVYSFNLDLNKPVYYGIEFINISFEFNDKGYPSTYVLDAYLVFFDEDVTVYGADSINAPVVTVKSGDKEYSEVYVPGATVEKPETPEAPEGYEFAGFYKDAEYTEEYDFSEKVDGDVTIYSKFVKSEKENKSGFISEAKAFFNTCGEWIKTNWILFTPCAVGGLALIIFAVILIVKASRR